MLLTLVIIDACLCLALCAACFSAQAWLVTAPGASLRSALRAINTGGNQRLARYARRALRARKHPAHKLTLLLYLENCLLLPLLGASAVFTSIAAHSASGDICRLGTAFALGEFAAFFISACKSYAALAQLHLLMRAQGLKEDDEAPPSSPLRPA